MRFKFTRDIGEAINLNEVYKAFVENGNDGCYLKPINDFELAQPASDRIRTAKAIMTDARVDIPNEFVLDLVWSVFERFILQNHNVDTGALDWYEAPIFNGWCNGAFETWYTMNGMKSKVSELESKNHRTVPKAYLDVMNRALDSHAKAIKASMDLFDKDEAPEELNHEDFDILTCKDILKQESIICDLGNKGWKLYTVDAPREWED